MVRLRRRRGCCTVGVGVWDGVVRLVLACRQRCVHRGACDSRVWRMRLTQYSTPSIGDGGGSGSEGACRHDRCNAWPQRRMRAQCHSAHRLLSVCVLDSHAFRQQPTQQPTAAEPLQWRGSIVAGGANARAATRTHPLAAPPHPAAPPPQTAPQSTKRATAQQPLLACTTGC